MRMNLCVRPIILFFLSLETLALTSCGLSTTTPPSPPPVVVEPLPLPPDSRIAVPVEISFDTLLDLLTKEAKKQALADGQTPPVKGTMLITEPLKQLKVQRFHDWEEKLIQKLPKPPHIPGLPHPPDPADIIKIIKHHDPLTPVIINEGEQVGGDILEHITKLIDKVLPDVSYVIHYKASFNGIENAKVDGSTMLATLLFDWDLKADAHPPLASGAKIKSVLTAKGLTAVKLTANISVNDNAKLKVAIPDHGVVPEIRKLEIAGIGVNLVPLIPLEPTAQLMRTTVGVALDNVPLGKIAQSLVDKQDDKLTFGSRIREELKKVGRPIPLGKDLFLDVAPSGLLIGNPVGITRTAKTYLQIPLELVTPIRLVFANTAPLPFSSTPISELPIEKATTANRIVDLQIVGDVALDKCTATLDTAVEKFWREQDYSKKGFTPGPTKIWGSTEGRFVIELPIRRGTSQDAFVRVFAWGTPKVTEEPAAGGSPVEDSKLVELVVNDMDWTAESSSTLVKALTWLAHDKLRDILRQNSKVSLAEQEKQIKDHSQISRAFDKLKISLTIQSHHVQGVSIQDGFLRLRVSAKGEPSITVE